MKIRRAWSGLFVGLLFGVGLAVAQMTNPEKIIGFLNLAGGWDPSLLVVMAAAVPVTFVGYRWVTRGAPLFDSQHHLPTRSDIDLELMLGAALFGVGWGIGGYCPGPAIAAVASGSLEPLVVLLAMVVGSEAGRIFVSRK